MGVRQKTQKEAEGRKLAAEADYDAKVKAAKAQKETLEMEAAGNRAQQMVPVEVAEKQVAVDTKRVNDVLKPELEAKAAHQQISVEFELGKLQIVAQQEVGKEYAKALGLMTSQANMTIFGDPTTLAAMAERFSKGLGIGQFVQGISQGNDQILPAVQSVLEKTGMTMGDLISKLSGKKADAGVAAASTKPVPEATKA